jgi:hypothetical protein
MQDYVGTADIVLFVFNVIASFLKQEGGFFWQPIELNY